MRGAPVAESRAVLRNGLRFVVVDNDLSPHGDVAVGDGAGFWIGIALRGELLLDGALCSIAVQPGTLRIIDFEAAERRWGRQDTANLGVLIFLPDTWCAACPCGGHCPVMHLRRTGPDVEPGGAPGAVRLDDHASQLVRDLVAGSADAHILHQEATVLRLLCWLQQATTTSSGPNPVRADLAQKIHRAAAIIERRLDSPPTIIELARLAAVNECDLKRLFKSIYGQSIASYSRAKRLEAARDLLRHSSLSITDVALEVGFRNPSRFATAFRRHFGKNPADYRRGMK